MQKITLLRRGLCVLVVLHMLAVLAEPLRFFSQSEYQPGPEFAALRRWTAPYVEWLYLDHGYFFFAPNPGPSHLVGAKVVSPPPIPAPTPTPLPAVPEVDLSQYAYLFPDRQRQWPRLRYHRYFMLSEFYNNSYAPKALPKELHDDLDFLNRWRRDRQFYERLGGSIARHLERLLGVDALELVRIERELFSPDQVLREGWRIDDPRGLILLPESFDEPQQEEIGR